MRYKVLVNNKDMMREEIEGVAPIYRFFNTERTSIHHE